MNTVDTTVQNKELLLSNESLFLGTVLTLTFNEDLANHEIDLGALTITNIDDRSIMADSNDSEWEYDEISGLSTMHVYFNTPDQDAELFAEQTKNDLTLFDFLHTPTTIEFYMEAEVLPQVLIYDYIMPRCNKVISQRYATLERYYEYH